LHISNELQKGGIHNYVMPVACNPSYLGDSNQEDYGLRQAQANRSQNSNTTNKNRARWCLPAIQATQEVDLCPGQPTPNWETPLKKKQNRLKVVAQVVDQLPI
jgi:hypothetical protein